MLKSIEFSGIKIKIQEEDIDKTNVIYLLEFPNKKMYIGQTRRLLRKRLISHCSKNSGCTKLKNAIQKYKEFNVFIIESNIAEELLDYFESLYIKIFNTIECGYNLKEGGKYCTHSEETRKKMSLSGRCMSPEKRKKINESHVGRKISEIGRANIGAGGCEAIKSIPDDIIFKSCNEAMMYYKISKITRYYNGKIHRRSGQTFVKINDL